MEIEMNECSVINIVSIDRYEIGERDGREGMICDE